MSEISGFDVIVIGGGHAGCEAASACARMGASTLLITNKFETIGAMSCNPAIGGLGKGQIVREIDALDGEMAQVIDNAGIQFRVLNASRGPAVQGLRAQADRKLYKKHMQERLISRENLTIIEGTAEDIGFDSHGNINSIITENGNKYKCKAVVITAGTFLRGVIHQGEKQTPAGRIGDKPSVGLAIALEKLGLPMGRLKTGTPARLDKNTINWDILEEQKGDNPPVPFSFMTDKITVPQISCFVTYTNEESHRAILDNLDRAPLYSGQISGTGPRYCPSIEDKVVRFADKDRHQIFLEPEGLDDDTIYPNGISTSLPIDIQDKMIRSIAGLENVNILEYGYAIEYDYFDPRNLKNTLESKSMNNLFLAGQVNGTTGYEEAGAQGLVAGVNAALKASGSSKEFTFDRTDSYIGVMIDDLITKGAPEPYRMFTSRAEYRLLLRNDNADQRLTPKGIEFGCVLSERQKFYSDKEKRIEQGKALLNKLSATPAELIKHGFNINQDGTKRTAFDLIRCPEINIKRLSGFWDELSNLSDDVIYQLETEALYSGYISRHEADIKAFKKDEELIIPVDIDYNSIGSLSTEVKQQLERVKPQTLGAASRIPGVTPAAVVAILRHVKRKDSSK